MMATRIDFASPTGSRSLLPWRCYQGHPRRSKRAMLLRSDSAIPLSEPIEDVEPDHSGAIR